MTIRELIVPELRYWIAYIKNMLGLQNWRYAIRPYWIYLALDDSVKPLYPEFSEKEGIE